MNYNDFVKQLKRHEGFRDRVYLDTEGIPTGGWGHAFLEDSKIPIEVAERLLYHDIMSVTRDYEALKLSIDDDDTVREYAIKNMLFNIGMRKLLQFKKMLAAIKERNYIVAAREMLNSKWAKQVGKRAYELSEMMRTGEYNSK